MPDASVSTMASLALAADRSPSCGFSVSSMVARCWAAPIPIFEQLALVAVSATTSKSSVVAAPQLIPAPPMLNPTLMSASGIGSAISVSVIERVSPATGSLAIESVRNHRTSGTGPSSRTEITSPSFNGISMVCEPDTTMRPNRNV